MVLVVQAVCRATEPEPRWSIRRGGEGRRRAQVARHPVAAHGAHGRACGGELVVHGRKVGAAVHPRKVGRGARVTLVVARRLGVSHGVRALHAGGGGGRQWV